MGKNVIHIVEIPKQLLCVTSYFSVMGAHGITKRGLSQCQSIPAYHNHSHEPDPTTDQPASKPASSPANKADSQPDNQPTSQLANQPASKPTTPCPPGKLNGWLAHWPICWRSRND